MNEIKVSSWLILTDHHLTRLLEICAADKIMDPSHHLMVKDRLREMFIDHRDGIANQVGTVMQVLPLVRGWYLNGEGDMVDGKGKRLRDPLDAVMVAVKTLQATYAACVEKNGPPPACTVAAHQLIKSLIKVYPNVGQQRESWTFELHGPDLTERSVNIRSDGGDYLLSVSEIGLNGLTPITNPLHVTMTLSRLASTMKKRENDFTY